MEKKNINGTDFYPTGSNADASWEAIHNKERVGITVSYDYNLKAFGVNWAGCGTQPISYTILFSSQLMAAATLAQQLNFAAATPM